MAAQPLLSVEKLTVSFDKQGYLPAQMTLGSFYHNGIGVPQDVKQAVEWYRKASEQQHPQGEHMVAWCYRNG